MDLEDLEDLDLDLEDLDLDLEDFLEDFLEDLELEDFLKSESSDSDSDSESSESDSELDESSDSDSYEGLLKELIVLLKELLELLYGGFAFNNSTLSVVDVENSDDGLESNCVNPSYDSESVVLEEVEEVEEDGAYLEFDEEE